MPVDWGLNWYRIRDELFLAALIVAVVSGATIPILELLRAFYYNGWVHSEKNTTLNIISGVLAVLCTGSVIVAVWTKNQMCTGGQNLLLQVGISMIASAIITIIVMIYRKLNENSIRRQQRWRYLPCLKGQTDRRDSLGAVEIQRLATDASGEIISNTTVPHGASSANSSREALSYWNESPSDSNSGESDDTDTSDSEPETVLTGTTSELTAESSSSANDIALARVPSRTIEVHAGLRGNYTNAGSEIAVVPEEANFVSLSVVSGV